MAKNKTKTVKKRHKQGKTNYKKRMLLLKGNLPRLVIRKSNKYIILQIVESKIAQDKIVFGVTSKELLKYGWPKESSGSLKSLCASYLTGFLMGNKFTKKIPVTKISNKTQEIFDNFILDLGLIPNTRSSRTYAALKGAVDAGLNVRLNKEIFPSQDRIEKFDFYNKVKKEIEKIK